MQGQQLLGQFILRRNSQQKLEKVISLSFPRQESEVLRERGVTGWIAEIIELSSDAESAISECSIIFPEM